MLSLHLTRCKAALPFLLLLTALFLVERADAAITFRNPVTMATGNVPIFVASADINKDSKLDLITLDSGVDRISYFQSNGNGTFQPRVQLTTGDNPHAAVIADFNKDTNLDILCTNIGGDSVSLIKGNGN